jgi:16S rRNA pseudouridine516 synthase
MHAMRLDQFISQTSAISRKQARIVIHHQRVMVNGLTIRDSAYPVTSQDTVNLDGEKLAWPGELYFLLYKPAGYCCSHEDDGHPSALTLLPATGKKLHFAGRLDADTTGLVLLSSDGAWCHRVTSPKKAKAKHYRATLASPIGDEELQRLRQGVLLRGEEKPTLPAEVEPIAVNTYRIVISEGRYHQVKRMFAAVGSRVENLHRFRIANIELDNSLAPGNYRPLSPDEIGQF